MFGLLKSLIRSTAAPASKVDAAPDREMVAFITAVDAPHFLQPGEFLESDQASVRLRVSLPACELARRLPVCLVPLDYVQRDPDLATLGKARAIVVGKLSTRFLGEAPARAEALVRWVERAAAGRRIVVDFADDLAAASTMTSQPTLLDFQTRLLQAAAATVPTLALQAQLAPYARHGISVIDDPYESPAAGVARFAPGRTLRLAWFGVFGEPLRPFIESALGAIARRLAGRPASLAFVTHAAEAARVADMAERLYAISPDFSVRHVAWSLAASAAELARADAVVLPQDTHSAWGRVKSHNRLVEALRAGRYAVAAPIPAYLELADYAWVDNDLGAGLQWAIDHPAEAVQKIAAGQAYVAERFSPARVAAEWGRVLSL